MAARQATFGGEGWDEFAPAPDAPEDHDLPAQIAEVEREIRMRRQVYPAQVRQGRMRQADAEQRMGLMLAVLRTLRRERARQGGAL